MTRHFGTAVCIGLLIAGAVSSARAWNYGGHMVSGAFAYDVLKKENPEALAKVVELLKQHPDFEKRWAKQLDKVDPDLRDQALFMWAARWPDDIRGTKYDHPPWHYIDFPYKPPGQPDTVSVADPPDPNAVVGFRANAAVLKDPQATAADKAVALCWIMHLTGDIHQPLHATSMFTTDYPAPKGDQGATKFWVRAKEGGNSIKLHSFWDDLILSSDNFQDVKNRAIEIRMEYPRDKLPELSQHVEPSDLQKWAEESFEQAKTAVYREGELQGSPQAERAPVLPEDYAAQTKPVAEHRMADAGYRLADVLATLMQPEATTANPSTTPGSDAPASTDVKPTVPGEVPSPPGEGQAVPGEESKAN